MATRVVGGEYDRALSTISATMWIRSEPTAASTWSSEVSPMSMRWYSSTSETAARMASETEIEREQGVAVAPHTGREVVEAEQALQPLRVLLVTLEVLDEGELLVDQRGAAAGERLEHVADLDAQARLVAGERECLLVEVVHGPGQLAHLLGGVHRDRLERRGVLAVADPANGLG